MNNRSIRLLCIILSNAIIAACIISTTPSFAGPVSKTHDGLFLRLLPGYGYGKAVEKELLGYDLEFTGWSGMVMFQAGFAFFNNVILFAEASGILMINPDVKHASQSDETKDTTYQVVSYGAGLSYYFMPINLYIAASLNASKAKLVVNNISANSETGVGFNASIGKEWWVSDNLGLGIAFILHYSSMKVKETDGNHDLTNLFYGVAFSATYN